MDQLLEARCLEFARELCGAYSDECPPFPLERLLKRFGVAAVRERPLDRDACLRLESGRIFIDVNIMYPLVRRRLSIAHEIGHLIVNEFSPREALGSHSEDPAIESLCNRLASSLLVPHDAVVEYFDRQQTLGDWQERIRCATVLGAASRFGVSVDAVASRVFHDLDMAPEAAAIVWRYTENMSKPGSEKAIRVASTWHRRKNDYIPRNKTVPRDSLIARAFEHSDTLTGTERLSLGTLRGLFRVEAQGFGRGTSRPDEKAYGAALSILRPICGDHPPSLS
jgi:Zn-dependent peptidase ImmA (M78 family)